MRHTYTHTHTQNYSPEYVHGRAGLFSPLQSGLVDAGNLAPTARLRRTHGNPTHPDLGPVVFGKRAPPSHHDAIAPRQKIRTNTARQSTAFRVWSKVRRVLTKQKREGNATSDKETTKQNGDVFFTRTGVKQIVPR